MMTSNPDGTITVRAVLQIQVDPVAWARDMMGEHPDNVLQTDVRRNVRRYVGQQVRELAMNESEHSDLDRVPIGDVRVEGVSL